MTRLTPCTIGAVLALALQAAPAPAQSARTFVSATGDDSTSCSRSLPCRTFQAAHDKTFANGEITVLDPGGYGAVTITKTISIINDGVGEAGVLVSGGGTGITINAGASDAVSLRGLTVKGIGFGGGTGITFNTGASLTIENCVVRNLTANGINFVPSASSKLAVSNTLVADNGGSGISVTPTGSPAVRATFSRVEAYHNGSFGIDVSGLSTTGGTINAAMADSVTGKNSVGIRAISETGKATNDVMVIRTVAANNGIGVSAVGTLTNLRVGRSTLTGNTDSWLNFSGFLRSYGDNNIDGNGDGDPAIPTIIAMK